MRDAVADVLAQRAALDRGTGFGVVLSITLHAAIVAAAVFSAMQRTPAQPATMVNIQFAKLPGPAATRARAATPRPPAPVEAPKIEEPKPRIEEPKPSVEPAKPAAVEKNTVPFSPFGQSTKKGSEAPPSAKPAAPAPAALPGGTASAEIPIGGAGVTGLEGGDFPYTLYIQGMQRRIGSNWFRPQIAGGAAAIVYFRINRNGSIADARIETSSGNGTFDRAALSAVRSSDPLTPLPFGYSGTWLGVHLTFR